MKSPHKRIGLVLSFVPGYSETFFTNKIKGLQARGLEVILFVDYPSKQTDGLSCKIVTAPDFTSKSLTSPIKSLLGVIKGLCLHPQRSLRLYRLDKTDGMSLKKRLRSVVLNQFLLTEDVDCLHFGFGMLAVGRENIAKAIQAKMAVSFRGYDLYLSPLKHPGCYHQLFQKEVNYHVLSEGMKHTLLDYGISKADISVIPPAIDTHFFKATHKRIRNTTEPIRLITVARLHWKKGLEYTFEALAILKKQGIDFTYSIIGDGDQLERLTFAAHQLGISNDVQFLGSLPQQEVKQHLEQSDVYLQYSIQEGFCNAVLEAQAMGLPCIVSNAEGLDENVLDGITGWVVPKRNPEALALKIKEVLSIPATELQQMADHAIARVRTDFNLEQQQTAFYNFYTSEQLTSLLTDF